MWYSNTHFVDNAKIKQKSIIARLKNQFTGACELCTIAVKSPFLMRFLCGLRKAGFHLKLSL